MEKNELSFSGKETTVAQIKDNFVENVINENLSAVEAGIFIKRLKKFTEDVYKGEKGKHVKKLIEDKTKENPEEALLYQITAKYQAVYTSYKFDECGDPEWDQLDAIIKEATELKKAREGELKAKYATFQEPEFVEGKPLIPKEFFNHIVSFDYNFEKIENGEEIVQVKIPSKLQNYGIKYTGVK